MSFYTSIAKYYDHIFPTQPKQVTFIADSLAPGSKILEVGCATGNLTIPLAQQGFEVSGIDLDPELIQICSQKTKAAGQNIWLQEGNMLHLPQIFKTEKFDGIVCVGNTLVHLQDEQLIGQFLKDAQGLLNAQGQLFLQIINYDRVLNQDLRALPTIDNERIRFERTYEQREDGAVNFSTKLSVKEEQHVIENSVRLVPLQSDPLTALCRKAGFTNVTLCGSFEGVPFDANSSYPLICTASK